MCKYLVALDYGRESLLPVKTGTDQSEAFFLGFKIQIYERIKM